MQIGVMLLDLSTHTDSSTPSISFREDEETLRFLKEKHDEIAEKHEQIDNKSRNRMKNTN